MAECKRPIILRARRDTLALLLAASAVTLALAHVIHHPPVAGDAAGALTGGTLMGGTLMGDSPAAARVTAAGPAAPDSDRVRDGDWAGHLSDPTMLVASTEESEPLSSAALTVSAAELKLPTVPVRPLVRMRPCPGCGEKSSQQVKAPQDVKSAAGKPAPRSALAAAEAAPPRPVPFAVSSREDADLLPPADIAPRHPHGRGLMTRLNPFSHLSDVARIGQPLAMAGNAVSAVFHRF